MDPAALGTAVSGPLSVGAMTGMVLAGTLALQRAFLLRSGEPVVLSGLRVHGSVDAFLLLALGSFIAEHAAESRLGWFDAGIAAASLVVGRDLVRSFRTLFVHNVKRLAAVRRMREALQDAGVPFVQPGDFFVIDGPRALIQFPMDPLGAHVLVELPRVLPGRKRLLQRFEQRVGEEPADDADGAWRRAGLLGVALVVVGGASLVETLFPR